MAEAAFYCSYACVDPNAKPKPKPKPKPPSAPTEKKNPVHLRTKSHSLKHNFSFRKSHHASKSGSASASTSTSTSKHVVSTNKHSSGSTFTSSDLNTKSTLFETPPPSPSLSPSPPPPTRTRAKTTPLQSVTTSKELNGRMFLSSSTTPLPDYKHSANQTTKTRAQSQAQSQTQANRTSSFTGGSSTSKHGSSIAELHAAPAARGSDVTGRSRSISSSTASSRLTQVTSSEPSATSALPTNPFTIRNGKRYLGDTTSVYPFPYDLAEMHRQTLRTMLLCQVFNGPVCSPAFSDKPPKRVLEVGCGIGFWSVMCHRHFSQRGFNNISFTGIDVTPLASRMESDNDMNWRFIQHDIRQTPLPFRDEEFSLIMCKDLSMTLNIATKGVMQALVDEYIRILKPGGVLELWDGDSNIRMLLPHTPPSTRESPDDSEDEDQAHTNAMGVYKLTQETPLATPHNQYLIDYNSWISKAFEIRKLPAVPCTSVRSLLLQESENFKDIDQRRLVIPLGEIRWEREGVGGAVTQGTTDHAVSSKGKTRDADRKNLTPGQAALRRTALLTFVQMIESLEPMLKEASGKGQDEWDRWQGNMMNDLLKNNGTSWGECLEVGAWWARKKKIPSE